MQFRYREGYMAFSDALPITLAQAIMSPADFTGWKFGSSFDATAMAHSRRRASTE
jgi:hypothetical protein